MKNDDGKTKKGISVRLDDATRADLKRVADKSGVSESDIIRICVTNGLPIVEETFGEMRHRFKALANQPSATEGRSDTGAYLMNEPKRRKAG